MVRRKGRGQVSEKDQIPGKGWGPGRRVQGVHRPGWEEGRNEEGWGPGEQGTLTMTASRLHHEPFLETGAKLSGSPEAECWSRKGQAQKSVQIRALPPRAAKPRAGA